MLTASSLLTAVLATIAIVTPTSHAIPTDAWMASISDSAPLHDLVIPGTHDSTAYNLVEPTGSGWVISQNSDITKQLQRGIRYFDYRVGMCQGTSNQLCMFHGKFYLALNFEGAIDMLQSFLATHPTETAFMRLKVERDDGLGDFQNFVEANHLNKRPALWLDGRSKSATDVALADARGKVVIFWDSGAKTSNYGYNFDLIDQRSGWEFDDLDQMGNTFRDRAVLSWDASKPGWFENPTSGLLYRQVPIFGGRLPITYAIDDVANRMMPRTNDIISHQSMKKGIVSMDFPTDEVVGKLIQFSLDRHSK